MNNIDALQYGSEDKSISSWIEQFGKQEKNQSANQIYRVLKQINSKKLALSSFFLIIDKITPQIIQLVDNLDVSRITENKRTPKTIKPGKLAIHLIKSLAIAYSDIAKSDNFDQQFDTEQQALIINRAIGIIGLASKYSALINVAPSNTLIAEMGNLYQIALENNLLEHEITEKCVNFIHQKTINSSIKKNLLFSIINPYQFTIKEMICLFELIKEQGDLIEILPEEMPDSAIFFWNFHTLKFPDSNHSGFNSRTHLLICTDKLIDHLIRYESNSDKLGLPRETIQKIVLTLSTYQDKMNSIIPATNRTAEVIIGFKECVDFLQKQSSLVKIHSVSDLDDADNSNRSLTIEPLEYEQKFAHFALSEYKERMSRKYRKGLLLATEDPNYSVIESKVKNCEVNDLIINVNNNRIETGIIRKKQDADHVKAQRLLVEKLKGEISFINITQGSTLKKGILQKTPDNEYIIYFKANRKSSDISIKLSFNNHESADFLLDKLIEITPTHKQYKINLH